MRLAELLNRAPDTAPRQVESFWGSAADWDGDFDDALEALPWGYHEEISVGRVVRNHLCLHCRDIRSFVSSERLSCLVVGERAISIDVPLRCSGCEATAEAWFIVGSNNDLLAPSPEMYLQRFSENRRDVARESSLDFNDQVDDLLERAQIAFDDGLGAGSMVYLRKVFEILTVQAGKATGVYSKTEKGKRKRFGDFLKEVDQKSGIIPGEFSENRYLLFSELSDVMHGSADEREALSKYSPCRRLVIGIVDNIRNNNEMSQAVAALGWNTGVNA